MTKRTETNMVWFDLVAAGCEVKRFVEVGVRHGVKFMGGRIVVHYREFCFLPILFLLLGGGSAKGYGWRERRRKDEKRDGKTERGRREDGKGETGRRTEKELELTPFCVR